MKKSTFATIALLTAAFLCACSDTAKKSAAENSDKPCISGIYPHLAMWNSDGECGTGALVPWAGKLWAITYPPHVFFNSDDKLYEIDKNLNVVERRESLGGTHADRLIHKASNQLFIGCYAIDSKGRVRAIPRNKMAGRITGCARSISDDNHKVFFATMEEGLYEVDVDTLAVREIIRDGNLKPHPDNADKSKATTSKLHGYHGKGFYSGFGRLFYSNNGVHDKRVATDPTIKSGALASWREGDKDWTPVRINQFTEITGPNGIYGSDTPEKSPIWALGFDAKSVILMLCENGKWTSLRLPKASHSYDGSHGWNTEWPRIRDVGSPKFLMTMHGAFWDFPANFDFQNSEGIRMKSNYLKVVGDFCRWNGKIILGCDDSAKKEFFNLRPMKSEFCSPARSNSNLVFLDEKQLDALGPAIGRGSVFLRENVAAGKESEPMLVGGFKNKTLALSCENAAPVKTVLRLYKSLGKKICEKEFDVSNSSPKFVEINTDAEWATVEPKSPAKKFTAHFDMSNPDARQTAPDPMFAGFAKISEGAASAARMWSTDDKKLAIAAYVKNSDGKVSELGTYEIDETLSITPAYLPSKTRARLSKTACEPKGVSFDKNSVLIVEDGKRRRLPLNPDFVRKNPFGFARVAREIATERDLFNCGGTFYELPARNAQGIDKIRPIASHSFDVFDYASYRGLTFISGMSASATRVANKHNLVSSDKKFALWAGSIDDLWKLGKPVGQGSAWLKESVKRGSLSDPFLMTGYDKKTMRLESETPVKIAVEIDVDGTGLWLKYGEYDIEAGKIFEKNMPKNFAGYWVRFRALGASKSVSATMIYR